MLRNRKTRRSGQPVLARFRPLMETFEKRELLTASPLFLQGTVFVDTVGNGVKTTTETGLANATLTLFAQGSSTPLATTTSGADGGYLFDGSKIAALVPGNYSIVETPPTGYANTAAAGFSQLGPYTVTQPNTIQVTLEPSTINTSFLSDTLPYVAGYYNLTQGGTTYTSPAGTFTPANYSTANGSTTLVPSFQSFCVDAGHELAPAVYTFGTTTDPQTSLPNGGQVGYLFNHYGAPGVTPSAFPASVSSNSLPDLLAAVQIAMWDEIYNNGASSGAFNIDLTKAYGNTTIAELTLDKQIATVLVADAAGKSEKVAVLDTTTNGDPSNLNSPHTSPGSQSILAGQSFNFGNVASVKNSIAGTVYADNNGNDALDGGDKGIAGVSVVLTTTSGSTVATTTSAADGTYSFTGLPAGSYVVTETIPAGYTGEAPNPGSAGGSPVFTPVSTTEVISSVSLTGNTNSTSNNFGQYQASSLSGNVYVDKLGTGALAAGDAPIPGTTLTLVNAAGTVVGTTTTAADGTYSFKNLAPGTYKVTETQPAGYAQGTNTVGTVNGTTDGVLVPTDMIGSIVLGSGQSSISNNFGELGVSLSGVVYVDATGNGLTGPQNSPPTTTPADTPESGVTVSLFTPGSTTPIATMVTGANGAYSFPGLAPGTYVVQEMTPSGYVQTYPTTVTYTVPATVGGANYPNNNFSNYTSQCTATPTNIIYKDNGVVIPGLRGYTHQGDTITATFTVPAGATDTLSLVAYEAPAATFSSATASQQMIVSVQTGTYTAGTYTETVTLPNSDYQVDFVCGSPITQFGPSGSNIFYGAEGRLFDADNGGTQAYALSSLAGTVYADGNGNDTLDAGDTGLGGITVYLANAAGTAVLATTTTAANGTYIFTGLAPGTYIVAEVPPAGYTGENSNAGSVGGTGSFIVGSNIEATTGIALNSNTAATGYNFGQLGSKISGTVYVDASGSGLTSANVPAANSGDTAEAGVTVNLINSAGTIVATTTTAADGTYSFAGIAYGTYTVKEVIPAGTYQTGPNSVTYAITTSATSPTSTGDNFSNYMACNANGLTNVKYFVNGVQVPTLGGYTSQGATVTVTFNNFGSSSLMLSLATYESQFNYFTPDNVSQQVLVGNQSGTFAPSQTATYSLTVTLPNSDYQVDFVCGAPIVHFGPGGSNVDYGEEGRFINGTIGGNNLPTPSTLAGVAYVDNNGNASFGAGDTPLANVPITLTGTTYVGANLVGTTLTPIAVTYTTTTSSTGAYSFANLAPGTYKVTETTPGGYINEIANVGSIGGSAVVGMVSSIPLNSNTAAVGYNFGELGSKISGTVYLDATGAGLTTTNAPMLGDTAEAGVTVIAKNTVTGVVTTTTTAADGTYSLVGLPFGTYSVTEVVPTSTFQTGPNALAYTVTTSAGSPTSTGDNFSNYVACNASGLNNVKYFVNGKQVPNLQGNGYQGATVTVTFSIAANASPTMLSLVAYEAPAPYYTSTNVSQQVITSVQTGTYAPSQTATYSLTVVLPKSYYQVDFVCGGALSQLEANGSKVDYQYQGRLIGYDNGGTCPPSSYCPPQLNVNQSDIGSVGTAGTASLVNGTYTLTASGSDIWNNADAGSYIYQALNGDGEIIARVDSISNTDPWAKAGVMIRQSLDPSSPQASVFATPGSGVVFQDRETQGGSSNSWSAGNSYGCNASTPVYVKLVRSGSTITGYDSSNGVTWSAIGSDTIAMNQQVYIGLAATSHNNSLVTTAKFDNVNTGGYWAGCAGQSLIQSCGGWSGTTTLSGWLSQCYPNLYGSNAGCDNLSGQNNTGVANFCLSLEAQYGAESLECQTLAAALDEYFTSWQAGGQYGQQAGFNVSWNGFCSTTVNTSGGSDAFGGCTSTSVWNMLQSENGQSWGGFLYNGNSARHQEACTVVYQVTSCGY